MATVGAGYGFGFSRELAGPPETLALRLSMPAPPALEATVDTDPLKAVMQGLATLQTAIQEMNGKLSQFDR